MLVLTAVVLATTGKLRLLLLGFDLIIAVAVGVFVYRTIEHPAHDVAVDPPPGSDAYRAKHEKEEAEAKAETQREEPSK